LSAKARRASLLICRGALVSLGLAAGCGQVLGIDDPPAVSECVQTADCGRGFRCVDFECVDECAGATCAAGGGAGDAHSGGASGNGDSGEGGRPAGFGGEAGRSGSSGGEAGAHGGEAGRTSSEGGMAGTSLGAGGAGADSGTSGAGGDAGGPSVTEECTAETSLCLICENGRYQPGTRCPDGACSESDGCINPRSCGGVTARCGANASCCRSLPLPGGTFSRSCDADCQDCDAAPRNYPASVSAFSLDAFEVTVARFRAFVVQYSGVAPEAGSGKNPRNPADEGWRTAWDEHLPGTRAALELSLSDDPDDPYDLCGPNGTWTAGPDLNESKPINCVDFYVAYAFCIWDGGRLPTEAEWNFAAAGGDEERVYPWSSPPESTYITAIHAVHGQSDDAPLGPSEVGKLPDGDGRFGHADLAGNVAEWVFDDSSICYPTPDQCSDCGYSSADSLRVLRGGSFIDAPDNVAVESRLAASEGYSFAGFRCVRDI
jgi:sulfatase modifying factor 1